jgi:hypothetical protein
MRHLRAYKLATTYKMTLMYFSVNIHINNQPTQYKMNGVLVVKELNVNISWWIIGKSQPYK